MSSTEQSRPHPASVSGSPCRPRCPYCPLTASQGLRLDGLDLADADILCAGHTHFPLVRRVGRRSAVNLGSVSNPSRHGDGPEASYVVIDATGPEADISHRSVDYDMQAVVQQLLDLRHPALGFIEDAYFNRHLDEGD